MQLLAKDGVFLPTAPRDITQGLLASGNRADVLINCPVGEFTFESRAENEKACDQKQNGTSTCRINGTLLHIRSIDRGPPPPGSPPQCDLPEFEVNRPCCDCGRHSNPDPTTRRTHRLIPGSPRALADLVNLRNQEVAKNVTFVMGGRIDPYCGDLETGCGIGNATKGVWASPGNTLYFDANHVQYTLPVGKVVGIDLHFVQVHPFHIHINP